MKIKLRSGITIDEVLCITPLEADDWLVEFYYSRLIDLGERIDQMHVDPAMAVKVYE